MKERKRIAEATAGRYRKAGKKEKGAILDEFVELTGFAQLRGPGVTESGAGSAGESQAAGARRRGKEVATAWARTDLRRADGESLGPGVAHHGLHLR